MSKVKANKTVAPDGPSVTYSSVLLKHSRDKKPKAFRIITTSLAKDKKKNWWKDSEGFPKWKQDKIN